MASNALSLAQGSRAQREREKQMQQEAELDRLLGARQRTALSDIDPRLAQLYDIGGGDAAIEQAQQMLFPPPAEPASLRDRQIDFLGGGAPQNMPMQEPFNVGGGMGTPEMQMAADEAFLPPTDVPQLGGPPGPDFSLLTDDAINQQVMQRMGLAQEPERRIVQGADQYKYYADTGERVLPNVQRPTDRRQPYQPQSPAGQAAG